MNAKEQEYWRDVGRTYAALRQAQHGYERISARMSALQAPDETVATRQAPVTIRRYASVFIR